MLKPCNTENMRKFVEALRSGEYTQGQDALEYVSNNGTILNCCLGVACRVAVKDGLNIEISIKSSARTFDGAGGFLPESVQDWLGIEGRNPALDIGRDGVSHGATHLNDTDRWTFAQIADAFERTYLTDENE